MSDEKDAGSDTLAPTEIPPAANDPATDAPAVTEPPANDPELGDGLGDGLGAPEDSLEEPQTVAEALAEDPGDPGAPEDGLSDEDQKSVAAHAKDEIVEIGKTIFYALLIALVLRVLLFQPFTIPSASMEPNLYEGDYIVVSKWDYGYSRHSAPFSPKLFEGRINPWKGQVKRGDIVVFKLPRDNKTDYIKRVIGLPGDRIQMRDNQLYINEEPVKEVAIGKTTIENGLGDRIEAAKLRETLPNGVVHTIQDFGPNMQLDTTGVYSVPEGYYFMMGDNRDNSIDSRVPPEYGVGFVPVENVVGRARVILFSWTPGASLWKPWTWVTHLRPSRFFTPLK